ncbi:MAG: hypothetical protein V4721_03290 [Bacteroidota bacterium]
MEYKVVPFVASIDHKEGSTSVAKQLQDKIDKHNREGWSYVRLEAVTTFVQPDGGCFGLGAKPGYTTANQVIVFEK